MVIPTGAPRSLSKSRSAWRRKARGWRKQSPRTTRLGKASSKCPWAPDIASPLAPEARSKSSSSLSTMRLEVVSSRARPEALVPTFVMLPESARPGSPAADASGASEEVASSMTPEADSLDGEVSVDSVATATAALEAGSHFAVEAGSCAIAVSAVVAGLATATAAAAEAATGGEAEVRTFLTSLGMLAAPCLRLSQAVVSATAGVVTSAVGRADALATSAVVISAVRRVAVLALVVATDSSLFTCVAALTGLLRAVAAVGLAAALEGLSAWAGAPRSPRLESSNDPGWEGAKAGKAATAKGARNASVSTSTPAEVPNGIVSLTTVAVAGERVTEAGREEAVLEPRPERSLVLALGG
mmetsp:Transcript_117134/g.261768  ORF Transcript_117134/g.261768 Transcript_117134/m.261768 type:complete len:357 (-) Transcript_117134:25-1095(-)